MNSRNASVIIPPSDEPDRAQIILFINFATTLFGLLCFGVALASGGRLIYLYIFPGTVENITADMLFAQVISSALLFLLGWVISFFSVKILNNGMLPYLLVVVGFFVSLLMAAIYFYGMYKCFKELDLNTWKYAAVLAAGYVVLVAFYLLTPRCDFRIMVAPLVVFLVLHIFGLVLHYVFFPVIKIEFIWSDLKLIAIIGILIGAMLNPRLYVPMRQAVNAVVDIISGALPPFLRNNTNPGPG